MVARVGPQLQLSPVTLSSVGRGSVVVGRGAGQRAACCGVGCSHGFTDVGFTDGADECGAAEGERVVAVVAGCVGDGTAVGEAVVAVPAGCVGDVAVGRSDEAEVWLTSVLVPEAVAELAAAALADAGLPPPPQPATTSAPAAASATAASDRARAARSRPGRTCPDRTCPDRAVSSDILVILTPQPTRLRTAARQSTTANTAPDTVA